jgi:hypothetical protein
MNNKVFFHVVKYVVKNFLQKEVIFNFLQKEVIFKENVYMAFFVVLLLVFVYYVKLMLSLFYHKPFWKMLKLVKSGKLFLKISIIWRSNSRLFIVMCDNKAIKWKNKFKLVNP